MKNFKQAYELIRKHEGGYANVSGDKGGETYAGISRVYFPEWSGWVYIDFIKKTHGGTIKHNANFPDIEYLVEEFYKGRYDKLRIGEIQDRRLAEFVFDYAIHSGPTGVKNIQRVLGVKVDGIIGPETLNALNSQPPVPLLNALVRDRERFLRTLATRPNQEKFLVGWLNRLSAFVPSNGTFVLIFIMVILMYGLKR